MLAAALLGASLATSIGCSGQSSPESLSEPLLKDFSRSTLAIESGQKTHDFSIYVADSNAERRQGLMFVESMPIDAGMLFIHEVSGRQSMWMKNTVLSLDMLFVRADGEIESIARDTTPGSLKSIASKGNVCCVLELNAGTTAALNIKEGDRLIHPHFQGQ